MTYKSEHLRILYRTVMNNGASPKQVGEFRDAIRGLQGDLYFLIYEQEIRRTTLLKQAWRVAEDVYNMYWGEDRYNSYNAMVQPYNRYAKRNENRSAGY